MYAVNLCSEQYTVPTTERDVSMKKTIIVLLILCICIPVFVACSTLKGDKDKGAVVNMYFGSLPSSFDPATVHMDADASTVLSLVYQPLTAVDTSGKVKPALAKNWYAYYDKRDSEYKMYFELNETMWSDGIAVSADDIVYAWKRILSPEFASPYASMLYPIKNAAKVKSGVMTSDDLGLVAEDDFLLCVTFEQDYDINLFAEIVSCLGLSPLREDIITKSEKDQASTSKSAEDNYDPWDINAALMVGNGAYRVQSYDAGVKLVLERNTFYYRDDEEDALDKSVIPYRLACYYQEGSIAVAGDNPISEQVYEYNRYTAGKTYYLGDFTKETFSALSSDITTDKQLSTYSYFFNTKKTLLSDPKVRQALSMAIDRQAIVDEIGKKYIPSTGFVPSGVFNDGKGSDFRKVGGALYSTTADINGAKNLLSSAGVKGGEITLSYIVPVKSAVYSNNSSKVDYYFETEIIANSVKASWESLGFTVTLKRLYSDNYLKALKEGDFDVMGLDFVTNSVDAFGYLAQFATRYSGNVVSIDFESETFTPHYTGLASAEYDTLIDSIVYVSDRAERANRLHNAEKLFAELCPATAVFQCTSSYVASDVISKITTDYYSYKDFSALRMKDYIDVNSKENAESIAEAEKHASLTASK